MSFPLQILSLRVRGQLLPHRRLSPLLRVQPPLDRQPEGRAALQFPARMSSRDGPLRERHEDPQVRRRAADGQAQFVFQGELGMKLQGGQSGRGQPFIDKCQ